MPSRTRRSKISWTGRPPRIVAGLLSGTSADGISAVLIRIGERKGSLSIRQLAYVTLPYPRGMRRTILENSLPGTGPVETVTKLHAAIGVAFAGAVRRLARRARIPMRSIDLIGSHGQTVHHLPHVSNVHGIRVRSTLQLGDPSVIAQETGIPVVGDFRTADMAVGGQGAPLVPMLDYLIFRSKTKNRLLLNLGGIANFTMVPRKATPDTIVAFDTGPANMVIDALAEDFFGKPFDRDGRRAREGNVNARLLRWMMSHRYLKRPPPKSTGREVFGQKYLGELTRRGRGLPGADLLATATEFTAMSVSDQYRRFVSRRHPVDEVLVSGGGVHNGYLMERLRQHFDPVPVRPVTDAGFSSDAKEAVLFAVLAYMTVLGRPSNLPHVSGAKRPVILGKMCLP